MPVTNSTHGCRVRILGKLHGQDCIQVLHFNTVTEVNDNPARDALILVLLQAVLACITEQLLDAVTSEYRLVGLEGTEVLPTIGDPIFLAAPANTIGTRGPTSSSVLATLIQIRTGLGGKTHRGRNFWPPAGEADSNVSILSGDVMTALTEFINCIAGKFIGPAKTEPWSIGVYSRKLGSPTNTQWPQGFTDATSMVASEVIAVMGTRKLNRGS
jgi:hypothetical protein